MKKHIYISIISLFVFNAIFAQSDSASKTTIKQPKIKYYITGFVTDSLNNPFRGVNVIVKKTLIGTVVDEKGKYKIDLTEFKIAKKKIIISYTNTGFKAVEKEIDFSKQQSKKNIEINITLKVKAQPINCDG